MTKRTVTALMGIATLTFLSCTQAAPEVVPTDNPEQPSNPTQPNNPDFGYCDYGPVTTHGGGCFEMGSADDCDLQWGQVVQSCPSSQQPTQPTTPSSSSVYTQPVARSSSSNTSTGGSVECGSYCKWATGCVVISTDPTGAYGSVISTCEAAITNCQKNSPSKQTYSNDACSGGTTTPSSSSKPSTVSSSSNAASGSVECNGYCKWDTGCFRISTDPTGAYGAITSSCIDAISNCLGNSPSMQVYKNATCTEV